MQRSGALQPAVVALLRARVRVQPGGRRGQGGRRKAVARPDGSTRWKLDRLVHGPARRGVRRSGGAACKSGPTRDGAGRCRQAPRRAEALRSARGGANREGGAGPRSPACGGNVGRGNAGRGEACRGETRRAEEGRPQGAQEGGAKSPPREAQGREEEREEVGEEERATPGEEERPAGRFPPRARPASLGPTHRALTAGARWSFPARGASRQRQILISGLPKLPPCMASSRCAGALTSPSTMSSLAAMRPAPCQAIASRRNSPRRCS